MNLFDVHTGCKSLGAKPRNATQNEVRAYLKWIAARQGVTVPANAEYHPAGIWSPSAREYIVEMPGHGQKQIVTCEILDDAGTVVRSMALPQDKKGGIPATAKQVQEWTGLKPVKAKRAKVADPIPVAAPAVEPVETQEALAPTCDKPEPAIAPTAAPAVDLESIAARIDALESALATLSAVSVDDREITTSLVAVTEAASCDHLPKRTPAHERAIRRAWAERKARRAARFMAELKRDQLENANRSIAYWRELAEAETSRANDTMRELSAANESLALGRAEMAVIAPMLAKYADRRRKADQRARRMIAKARAQVELKTRALEITNATVARLKSSATPASEIASLKQERDRAQTALAAMAARAERAEQSNYAMAERFEGLVSRVTRAEAALRQKHVA